MTEIIKEDDLPTDVAANAMASKWVAGANARASRVAPCLAATDPGPTDDQLVEAQLILIGAVIRWSKSGSSGVQTLTAGIYSETLDTRQRGGFNLWPSEIKQLQDICKNGSKAKAFVVDTVPWVIYHSPVCSLYFGGSSCSCGASIARRPIYEQYL